MGIRVIVIDENGKVATTMRPSRDYLYHDAVVAESVAAPKATILCNELGLTNVTLEWMPGN